jgi:hypothetical protein
MATITIKFEGQVELKHATFRGIGEIKKMLYDTNKSWVKLTMPRMYHSRFENVVKRVLTKNLTEQGITPLSIEYSE